MEIEEIVVEYEMTNQLRSIGFGALMKVFREVEVASGVEDKRKRVTWGRINPNKPHNVRVGELGVRPHFSEISLG